MSTSAPGTSSSRQQKRMGPAPFASFEDLSDEVRSRLESPDDKTVAGSVVRLPGIREDLTPTTPVMADRSPDAYPCKGISLIGTSTAPRSPNPPKKNNIKPPATPRIDISRASSSSHHDSKDSSPEREIYDAHDPNTAKLGLGFKEDGALDLRSSTEELDFQDMSSTERRRSGKARPASPSVLEEPAGARKDSQCSDIVLLSISGRTSRLSSIGSQGSNQSRLSNASHMSILSGQSGISRCSSPHKMLLETSFCGPRAGEAVETVEESRTGTKVESEVLEKVLLARKHDPTEAILAEGISVEKAQPLTAKPRAEKPPRKQDSKEMKISDITITVDKSENESNNTTKVKSRFVAESGVEYYYIPLKGPLPPDLPKAATGPQLSKPKLREVKSANFQSKSTHGGKSKVPESKPRCKSATPTPSPSITKKEEPARRKTEEPKYIRIKLKPDRCYPDEPEIHKPDTLPLDPAEPDSNCSISKSVSNGSPKIIAAPAEDRIETVTPSPSISRRSSFASLFKSKDAVTSPESPSAPGSGRRKTTITGMLKEAGDSLRSRSRSKSRDRDSHKSVSTAPSSTESIDIKSKNKSVLSLFKGKRDKPRSESETSSLETVRSGDVPAKPEPAVKSSYYENPLDCATVRIPLHSPTYYENRSISDWKTSSQDSQETVIENVVKKVNVETANVEEASRTVRQSSTSSENIVFTTKLGNDDEVFTTKLPKKLPDDDVPKVINGIEETVELHVLEEPPEEPAKIQLITSSVKEVHQEPIEDKRISQISQVSVGAVSSVSSLTEDHNSSESEKDVEDNAKAKNELKLDLDVSEIERKAIVLQQDSFEDELPYVPTTLPQERSAALPIVPVKQRSTFDMRTCPIDRPRSTTPINPSCLEEYCEEVMGNFNVDSVTRTIEKLRISLPRNESFDKTCKAKSPRKMEFNANWSEFAVAPAKAVQASWINFEDIPEKRKAPKRIQTIPSRGYIEVPEAVLQESVVYSYVNPDECKCECHELNAKKRDKRPKEPEPGLVQEDELPLLDDDIVDDDKAVAERVKLDVSVSDCRSIISDSSVDLSTCVDTHEASAKELTLRTPFTSDLGLSSNRSSVASQDDHQSPESPNAFPKIS